ncbi:aminotransferase-like [Striga asiatica]|uniref:Aminotransferase-like n=1 Tax=Striga asiatica TaxID=4170 RepID=A0A5A7PH51_STRAF|nr:aminotransferase-like [Striga asiatica]
MDDRWSCRPPRRESDRPAVLKRQMPENSEAGGGDLPTAALVAEPTMVGWGCYCGVVLCEREWEGWESVRSLGTVSTPDSDRSTRRRKGTSSRVMTGGHGKIGKLYSIDKYLHSNDPDFFQELMQIGGIFHTLGLPDVHILGPFVSVLFEFFTAETSMFTINGHVMGITLEDVLYLLRLPINGELVLVGENSHLSYIKIFEEDPKKVKISNLNRIIYNSNENKERRMIALLLIIIWHFVLPTKNGDGIYPSLASLLENPYNTSSIHAWGAAVLAFLHGRKKKNKEGGNLWLVLAFFLVRILKLWMILGVEITREELEELARVDYPLKWIMTRLEKVSKNTRVNYKVALRNALESLEDEVLKLIYRYSLEAVHDVGITRRVSPIFANNYVVHHAPNLLAKQFGLTNNVKFTLYHIGMKDNRGSKSHNWTKKYEVHIAKWMNPLFLGDPPAVHRETTPREDPLPHIQDDTAEISPSSEDPPSSSREDPSNRISKVADPHAAHQETGPDPPESFEPITDPRTPMDTQEIEETNSVASPRVAFSQVYVRRNKRKQLTEEQGAQNVPIAPVQRKGIRMRKQTKIISLSDFADQGAPIAPVQRKSSRVLKKTKRFSLSDFA